MGGGWDIEILWQHCDAMQYKEFERQDWQDLTCKGVFRCSFSSSMFNFRGIHTVEHEFETREEDEPRMEKTC